MSKFDKDLEDLYYFRDPLEILDNLRLTKIDVKTLTEQVFTICMSDIVMIVYETEYSKFLQNDGRAYIAHLDVCSNDEGMNKLYRLPNTAMDDSFLSLNHKDGEVVGFTDHKDFENKLKETELYRYCAKHRNVERIHFKVAGYLYFFCNNTTDDAHAWFNIKKLTDANTPNTGSITDSPSHSYFLFFNSCYIQIDTKYISSSQLRGEIDTAEIYAFPYEVLGRSLYGWCYYANKDGFRLGKYFFKPKLSKDSSGYQYFQGTDIIEEYYADEEGSDAWTNKDGTVIIQIVPDYDGYDSEYITLINTSGGNSVAKKIQLLGLDTPDFNYRVARVVNENGRDYLK